MSHPSLEAFRSRLATSKPFSESRLLDIFNYAADELDDVIDAIGIEPAILYLQGLYDTYCAPANIPYVPDILEPTLIDAPAKLLIASLVRRFHDKIHKA